MLKTSFHSGCEADGGLDVDEDAAGSTSGGSSNGGGGKASVGMVLASRCGIGRIIGRRCPRSSCRNSSFCSRSSLFSRNNSSMMSAIFSYLAWNLIFSSASSS